MVATTRPNPPSQATQLVDLIQALRQNDSPIRTHFAQVGLGLTSGRLRGLVLRLLCLALRYQLLYAISIFCESRGFPSNCE